MLYHGGYTLHDHMNIFLLLGGSGPFNKIVQITYKKIKKKVSLYMTLQILATNLPGQMIAEND